MFINNIYIYTKMNAHKPAEGSLVPVVRCTIISCMWYRATIITVTIVHCTIVDKSNSEFFIISWMIKKCLNYYELFSKLIDIHQELLHTIILFTKHNFVYKLLWIVYCSKGCLFLVFLRPKKFAIQC